LRKHLRETGAKLVVADADSATSFPTRRAYLLLCTAILATGMGQTMLFAVLGPLGREIGLGEVQINAIISASSITFFFCSAFWGRMSDVWGRRRVMLVGLVGYTTGTLLFASSIYVALIGLLAPTAAFVVITAARMAQSSVMSATPPAASAFVADITTEETRTRGMSSIGAAQNAGAIVGPAVSGLLAIFSLLTPVWVAASLTFIAACLVYLFLPDAPRRAQRPRSGRLRYTDPRILPFVVVGVVMFLDLSVVQQTLAFRMQDVLHLTGPETARNFGFAMMLSAAASLAAQVGIVQRMSLAPMTLLRVAMPPLLAAFALISLATDERVLFAAMALLGFGMGLAGPGFTAGASVAVSAAEQGALAGVTSSCPPLGFTIGPLLGAWLYQIDGRLPYVVALGLCSAIAGFTFWRAAGRVPEIARSPAEKRVPGSPAESDLSIFRDVS
jgi:MFS family permease